MDAASKKAWITIALCFLPVSLMMRPVGFFVFWVILAVMVLAKPYRVRNNPRKPE